MATASKTFELDSLIEACQHALTTDTPQEAIRNIVSDMIQDHHQVRQALGQQNVASVEKLYASETLSIVNFVWAPHMTMPAHNHNMWAVVGVYEGREDHIFWRRKKDAGEGEIEAAGAASISSGEVICMNIDAIHSVTNPTNLFTRAIHIYAGDFFEIERSEWETLSLTENLFDPEKNRERFESENRKYQAIKGR
ncbi:hypothetical protein A1OS_19235 [Enterovibrio norvegicus]|uniref:hypothetical protein n=1 Tax=Enterovibrio norvegicus TaxID=188144 RepID=UPI0002F09050|nr:hypothetical protein [Enterovibrio norvegicus]OEE61442.1 hypothetical protein A1OS_19235 [Enterovibrio norvegicus]